jgi:tetratricopeptide (TPR) repeat protein
MREDNLLQQAITAARAGYELTARDMFLRVVEVEPKNELAWMWLTGLLDNLDDRIHACEQIMGINPRNANAKQYLAQLLIEKQKILDAENIRVEERVREIRNAVKSGRKDSMLADLRVLVLNQQLKNPEAWRLLADLSPELDERTRALEKFVELAPHDLNAQEELKQARHFKEHPIHQAELYEEQGEIEKALLAYRMVALKAESKEQWERIYWKVTQLENQNQEHIAHVSPALSIARLTAGPPLVYFMFLLVHVGVNPFAHSDPFFWLGLLWVTLGGFLIALASVHSHNRLWALLFGDVGASGTPMARLATVAAGWVLVLLPHVMLFVSAWYRLMDYEFSYP